MNSIPVEDINYLAEQSSRKINIILSGMTALMNDTDNKVEVMESQGWFKRMIKTVSRKNKLTKDEIRKNYDKLNAYMSEAIAELYNRNCIDEKVIMSLCTQLNELYADHVQLKQMLGAFVSKLNEKIDRIDNFNMLKTEIDKGIYSLDTPIFAMCKIISQFDNRILEDASKLDILRRSMVSQNIINDEQIKLTDYLNNILQIPVEEIGQIYLELGAIKDNFISNVIIKMIEKYHFLTDMERKFKNKDSLIEEVISSEKLDGTIKLSISDIYDDFISSKLDVNNTLVTINNTQVDSILEKAEQLYSECKFDEAFKLFKDLAESGDVNAQYKLGVFYYFGDGIEEDLKESFKWYMKAAEQGSVKAQNRIGDFYYFGDGVEKDLKEAFKWYMKTAENGDTYAQYKIGDFYYYGEGVEKDLKEAFKWYMRAAENENAKAQCIIGDFYYYGERVEKNLTKELKWFNWYMKFTNNEDTNTQNTVDRKYKREEVVERNLKEAFKWYMKAAENGDTDAQNAIAIIYEKGEGVEKNLKEAFKWYMKAAENGNTDAQNTVGKKYKRGDGVEKDLKEAFKWYMKAAEWEDTKAQFNIAKCYENGEGVEKNLREAFRWYLKAAENGDLDAQNSVAIRYQRGEGVEKNLKEAFKWYLKAAENEELYGRFDAGHCYYSQFNLGHCYYYGIGTAKDLKEAFKWYIKSAENGYTKAQCLLGYYYHKGEGVEKDLKEAFKWYMKAAENGDQDAQNRLGVRYYKGEGVERNLTEAFKWFIKSAEQGNVKAQTNVGICYCFGIGVLADNENSKKWLRKASNKGYDPASSILAKWYKEGNGSISNELIKDIYEDAHELIKSLCESFINYCASEFNIASKFNVSYNLKQNLGINDYRKIYLAYEPMFTSRGEGFAITSDGIYYIKSSEPDTHYISYKQLSKVSNIYRNAGTICFDNKVIARCIGLDSKENDLVDLFCKIKRLVSFDY